MGLVPSGPTGVTRLSFLPQLSGGAWFLNYWFLEQVDVFNLGFME